MVKGTNLPPTAALQSYIFLSFHQVTFKLGKFTDFKAFFPAMLMESKKKAEKTMEGSILPHAKNSRFQNLCKFCLWNPESWALESRIQFKELGILTRNRIQNPPSTEKDWNQVPGIRNPRHGIQNPTLSWIPLYGRSISPTYSRVKRLHH